MRHLILIIAISMTSVFCIAQNKEGISITVTVDNVQNNDGVVSFALHTKDSFLKGPGVKSLASNIEDGKVTVTFYDILPGEYAIMVLHDENENNRMDFQTNGMPKESYGMSNNVMSFGPPQYSDAKFTVSDKDIDMSIRF